MIISGTITSAPVGGVTVQDPADQSAPQGFGVVANGMRWTATPSPNFAVSALGTVTTAATLDWSVAGLFTLTLTTTDSCAVAFANVSIGQVIRVAITDVTGTGTALTWPSTVTWEGGVLPGATPAAGVILVEITCFGLNTYFGTTRVLHS
jgi:hypothetical protein